MYKYIDCQPKLCLGKDLFFEDVSWDFDYRITFKLLLVIKKYNTFLHITLKEHFISFMICQWLSCLYIVCLILVDSLMVD